MKICYASEVGLRYDHPKLQYFEVNCLGEKELYSRVGCMNELCDNSLCAAIKRAKNGGSLIYALATDEYGNITKYIINDLDAVLAYYGLLPSGHRHNLTWKYNERDNGKSSYAEVDLTMNCGCKICLSNTRMLEKELREQFGLRLVMSSIHTSEESNQATVRFSRSSLRGKDNHLK